MSDNALVPAPVQSKGESRMMALAANPIFGERRFWTSLASDDKANRKLIMKALNDCDKTIEDMIGKRLKIVNVLAHDAEKVDEKTGEVKALVRIVLIDDKGVCYQCFSAGVRSCIEAIASIDGLPPWNPPQHVEIKQKSIGDGKRLFLLSPVD